MADRGDDVAVVHGWLLGLLKELRVEFARRLKELRRDFPRHKLPCDTCAFRAGTDNDIGFERTILHFIAALVKGTPFYCHHGMSYRNGRGWTPRKKRKDGKLVIDERKLEFCTAWMVLSSTVPEPFDIKTVLDEDTGQEIAALMTEVE